MAATGDTSPGLDLSPVEILSTTRSVRRRLDLAQQAPTGGNQQGWSFVFVTDPRKRQALGALYKQGWDAYRQSMADRVASEAPASMPSRDTVRVYHSAQ